MGKKNRSMRKKNQNHKKSREFVAKDGSYQNTKYGYDINIWNIFGGVSLFLMKKLHK